MTIIENTLFRPTDGALNWDDFYDIQYGGHLADMWDRRLEIWNTSFHGQWIETIKEELQLCR